MVNKFMKMTYQETLDYLFNKLPMFQRTGPAAYKNTLENILRLDELYEYPHQKFKTVHVAGTNGKGSVSHMVASVLQEAGFKTGLYTSPHLKDFRERIKINGIMIPEEEVVEWVVNFELQNKSWKIQPSFFELTVAMAFDYFAQQDVDIAVVEVGLGGRLDSTNIISPEIGIITNIGLDHTNLLGDTIEKIAWEKAGIIKKDIPVIIGQKQEGSSKIFKQKAEEVQAPIFFSENDFQLDYSLMGTDGKQIFNVRNEGGIIYPELKLDLVGLYQKRNIIPVLKGIEILNNQGLKIPQQAVYAGLVNCTKNTGLLGRWQILGNNPLVICDIGHNEDGMKAIVEQLKNTAYKKLHFVFGTVGDKDPNPVLKLLPIIARYYFTKASIPRALDEKTLSKKAKEIGLLGDAFSCVNDAYKAAMGNAEKNDLVFIGGSTFIVSEIL